MMIPPRPMIPGRSYSSCPKLYMLLGTMTWQVIPPEHILCVYLPIFRRFICRKARSVCRSQGGGEKNLPGGRKKGGPDLGNFFMPYKGCLSLLSRKVRRLKRPLKGLTSEARIKATKEREKKRGGGGEKNSGGAYTKLSINSGESEETPD